MLAIRNLSASYDGIPALHRVDLDVAPGEYVGLIGPNGAGKTTLAKTLSGIVTADTGTAQLENVDLLTLPGHDRVERGLVHVPQGRRVFPELTVQENLQLGAYRPSARDDAAERLAQVHELFPILADRAEQHAGTLSGGQQQMLAVGRGLMARPRLLVLDEPSMGLAPVIVEEIFDALDHLRELGDMSVLLIEQLAHEAMELCDRVYVIESGEIVTSGPTSQMLNDRAVVATYLGHV